MTIVAGAVFGPALPISGARIGRHRIFRVAGAAVRRGRVGPWRDVEHGAGRSRFKWIHRPASPRFRRPSIRGPQHGLCVGLGCSWRALSGSNPGQRSARLPGFDGLFGRRIAHIIPCLQGRRGNSAWRAPHRPLVIARPGPHVWAAPPSVRRAQSRPMRRGSDFIHGSIFLAPRGRGGGRARGQGRNLASWDAPFRRAARRRTRRTQGAGPVRRARPASAGLRAEAPGRLSEPWRATAAAAGSGRRSAAGGP